MRVSYLLVLATLVLCSCGVSQRAAIDQSPRAVSIPLTFSQGLPFLTAEIQGKQFPLMLDLGGFSTISLSDSILKMLNVHYAGSRSSSDAYGNSYDARNYIIPEVKLAGITVRSIEGSEHMNHLVPSQARCGYVGYGLISKFSRVIIDYPNQVLVLLQDSTLPSEYRNKPWITSSFIDKGGVVSDVTVDGEELSFWWDTGANYSIIDPEYAHKDRTQQAGNVPIYTPASIRIAGQELKQTEFAALHFPGPGEDGLIGYSFFINHTVLLDFKQQTVSVY